MYSLVQLGPNYEDDLSRLYWDLCIDHRYFQHPENSAVDNCYVLSLVPPSQPI